MCLFNSGRNLPAKKNKLVEIRPEKYEGKNSTMSVTFLYLSLILLYLFRENTEQ